MFALLNHRLDGAFQLDEDRIRRIRARDQNDPQNEITRDINIHQQRDMQRRMVEIQRQEREYRQRLIMEEQQRRRQVEEGLRREQQEVQQKEANRFLNIINDFGKLLSNSLRGTIRF